MFGSRVQAGLALLLLASAGFLLGGRVGLMASFMLVAVYTDLLSRKIPNSLVLAGMVTGVACQLLLPNGAGVISSLQGLGLGLLLFLPLYILRAMGAGDVKLMAMVGAFIGSEQIFGAVLGTFLVGGVLSLLVSIRNKAFARLLSNLRLMAFDAAGKLAQGQLPVADNAVVSVGKLPYAAAITLGTLGYLTLQLYLSS